MVEMMVAKMIRFMSYCFYFGKDTNKCAEKQTFYDFSHNIFPSSSYFVNHY